MLGTGLVSIDPKGTLVRRSTVTDQTAYWGGGRALLSDAALLPAR